MHETITPGRERSDVTRAKIIEAARELVVEKGYADVSTAQVMARAGVSRGGLYHHFSGKDQLMAAVLEAVEVDLLDRLVAVAAEQPDPFAALATGVGWYLDECIRSPELQRIGLYEGRKALGWVAWRDTVAPYGLEVLAQGLRAAIDAGQIEPADPHALAYLLLAALHEAVTIVITAPDPLAERARVGPAVELLVDGLRAR
jgi:AcrR family transcriptional regulator